ncbi:hypothetical protein SDC9_06481 [bioreactor metagenome]|uniref:Uncharacterized protein n=1 Tax=bioreactor metagenome TaxID=1076179 RepID=A0A644T338_9ZZZZ
MPGRRVVKEAVRGILRPRPGVEGHFGQRAARNPRESPMRHAQRVALGSGVAVEIEDVVDILRPRQPVEDEGIGAAAAAQRVISLPAGQGVVEHIAEERVRERIAGAAQPLDPRPRGIACGLQIQPLDVLRQHGRDIGAHGVETAVRPFDHLIAGVAHDVDVIPRPAKHGIGIAAAVDEIVTGSAGDPVRQRIADAAQCRAGEHQVLEMRHRQREIDRGDHRVGSPPASPFDDQVAGSVDMEDVGAVAAGHPVRPGAAVERVGAIAAEQDISAEAAVQQVIAETAIERVGAGPADQRVGAAAAEDLVFPDRAGQPVRRSIAADRGDRRNGIRGAGIKRRVLAAERDRAAHHAVEPAAREHHRIAARFETELVAARVPGPGGHRVAIAGDGDGDAAHPLARIVDGIAIGIVKDHAQKLWHGIRAGPEVLGHHPGADGGRGRPIGKRANADLGIGTVQDRNPVPGRVLHPARTIAPVDEEAGMGVKRILGIGEDVFAHPQRRIARGKDPGAERGLAGKLVRLRVLIDHQPAVSERGIGEQPVPGERRDRVIGGKLFAEQREIDPEIADRGGDVRGDGGAAAGIGDQRVELPGRIHPGAVDVLQEFLLESRRLSHLSIRPEAVPVAGQGKERLRPRSIRTEFCGIFMAGRPHLRPAGPRSAKWAAFCRGNPIYAV